MSNDDTTPNPNDDLTPEQGIGALAEPPADGPVPGPTDGAPPADATQVLPVVPTLPAAAPPPAAGEPVIPPPASGAIPTEPTHTLPPAAWYRQPGAVAGILLGFLVVGALIVFLVVASGDDDDADGVLDDVTPDAVSLVLTRTSSGGQAIDTALSATVTGQGAAVDDYRWVLPADGVVGQAGLRETDGTGRLEFRWAPSEAADAAAWSSTVELAEFIAPEGEQPVTDLAVDCVLDRDGVSNPVVSDAVVEPNANDPLGAVGKYTFPNLQLVAGDRIECTSTNVVAEPAPVVSESTTTVPESTTTVPETTTTVAETTTTVPETTTTTTTTTSTTTTTTSTTTTTTTTTAPPPTAPTLTELLAGRSELSDSAALLDRVGLLDELEASEAPFTLFVPNNAAIEALENGENPPDLSDDDAVRELFRAHFQVGTRIDDLTTVSEIFVDNGGPQPVDSSTNPITVGGVDVVDTDVQLEVGIVHVLAGVLEIQP